MIKNEDFKEEFVQRFFYHLTTTFEGGNVLKELDEIEQTYRPLMVDHINRWNYPGSMNLWNESIQGLRGFIIKRPAVMVQQLMKYLGEQYVLYPNPVEGSKGYVNIDMEYSEDVPVQFEIYDNQGQMVKKIDLAGATIDVHPRIPLANMSPGLYFVRINYGSLLFVEKLIVQ